VGTYAIQIAKIRGARVTTTCSTGNVKLCGDLGADEIIDYRTADVIGMLKEKGRIFDTIVDNVGDPNLASQSSAILKKGGLYVQVGVGSSLSPTVMISTLGRLLWPGGNKYQFIQMKSETALFDQLGHWMKEGKLQPVIDEEFQFENVPKAFEKLRAGHARGKIVIHVNDKV
jgi:NADPH:quinone reductase-like Zn-dependent oxidoreductase